MILKNIYLKKLRQGVVKRLIPNLSPQQRWTNIIAVDVIIYREKSL